MNRTMLLLVCLLVLAGCGQKGPLIAPERVPAAQPAGADDAVADEEPDPDEDAEDRRRRDR